MDVTRKSACLVVKYITVNSYGFFFNFTMVGQASYLMMTLADSFHPCVGACCLSLAGPTLAQLEVCFSSDYL